MWAEAGAGEEVSGWRTEAGVRWGGVRRTRVSPTVRADEKFNILISVGPEPGAGHGKCIS